LKINKIKINKIKIIYRYLRLVIGMKLSFLLPVCQSMQNLSSIGLIQNALLKGDILEMYDYLFV